MAKRASQFVCQSCGAVTPKWSGRCESCGEWNAIIEEPLASAAPGGLGPGGRGGRAAQKLAFHALDGPERDADQVFHETREGLLAYAFGHGRPGR